jgi:hypothetical protein
MSGEDVVLAAVKAEIREPDGWTLRCELGGGGYIVYAEHPASFGLVLETAAADTSLATARALRLLDHPGGGRRGSGTHAPRHRDGSADPDHRV